MQEALGRFLKRMFNLVATYHRGNSRASNQSSAKSFWPLVLSLQQSHHHIVVPGVVHESSFSFPSLLDKAAFLVGPDRTSVVRKHSYPYSVQSQMREGMSTTRRMDSLPSPFPSNSGSKMPTAMDARRSLGSRLSSLISPTSRP